MLRLRSKDLLTKKEIFEKREIRIPRFNFEKVWEKTKQKPTWVHYGGGNLFRAFHAVCQQRLLEKCLVDTGIIVISTRKDGLIENVYDPHDNLSLHVVMKADGSLDTKIIASVAEAIQAKAAQENWERLKEIFRAPSLQMVTLTITEKGYALTGLDGELLTWVREEIVKGPGPATHTIVALTALLWERYQNGAYPLALVSTDNFSHNGDHLRKAVVTVATKWHEMKLVDDGFLQFLQDGEKISFPWSVIDKITPHPSPYVEEKLHNLGFVDVKRIDRGKQKSPIAAYVNTEEAEYLVIEDHFPNGRPPLEKAGVYFTDKETVDRFERMKVCTCLNPLHTALAIFGCLFGYQSVADEMKDSDLRLLVEKIGYEEGMKVVVDPGIIDPEQFIREVIDERLPNPYIPDTPQRIATDTSQKIPIRFGETIKAYVSRDDLHTEDLTYIPLTLAGWLRYLLGIDDEGNSLTISPDPLLPELQELLMPIRFGKPETVKDHLRPLLIKEEIFGVNLYEVGLGEKVEQFFEQMIKGPGAVRKTLREALYPIRQS